jgi:NADH-ubiquinone oxidoreductase chain 6
LSTWLIKEGLTNGFADQTIDVILIFCIISGILIITSNNPIVSVLFLIGLFLSIATYLILLGMNFIGLSYLLVYVGAVSILFLFILMLINIRVSELLSPNYNTITLAIIIGIAFNFSFNNVIPSSLIDYKDSLIKYIGEMLWNVFTTFKSNDLYYSSSNVWDGNMVNMDHINTLGSVMYTNYSIWLIVTALILLLAMVGAIVITLKSEDTDEKTESTYDINTNN